MSTTSQVRLLTVLLALGSATTISAQSYSAYYTPSASGLPYNTEQGQSGTNDCGTGSSPTSMCQNVYINSLTDFCLWAPPNGGEVATFEATEVSYCTQSGRGTRLIPEGTFDSAHFVQTPHYVQITGSGDFTKIGITAGDQGGELDPHGATGVGNPVGGLVFHAGVQLHEWFNFMSATQYCIRACFDGPRATSLCRHTYDELGCDFNAPGNYESGVFESCEGNDAKDIMYNYPGLSTFQQADTEYGVQVPSAHPAPASYNCVSTSQAALFGTVSGFGVSPTSTSTSSSSSSSSSSSTSSSSSSTSTSTSTSTSSSSVTLSFAPSVVSVSTSPFGTGSSSSSSSSSNSEAASSGVESLVFSRSAISAVAAVAVAALFGIAL